MGDTIKEGISDESLTDESTSDEMLEMDSLGPDAEELVALQEERDRVCMGHTWASFFLILSSSIYIALFSMALVYRSIIGESFPTQVVLFVAMLTTTLLCIALCCYMICTHTAFQDLYIKVARTHGEDTVRATLRSTGVYIFQYPKMPLHEAKPPSSPRKDKDMDMDM